jgi:hypothetical protein
MAGGNTAELQLVSCSVLPLLLMGREVELCC